MRRRDLLASTAVSLLIDAQDELRYHIRHDLFLRPAQEIMTFRAP